jgi:hypothetical protein
MSHAFSRCRFEIFECARKIMLVGIPIFLPMGSNIQLIVGLQICFISSMVIGVLGIRSRY